jgi:type IX secretion system PorP/SprF family membrane protein
MVVSFLVATLSVSGQDIPLFTQKLTNSFIYNPALAGNTFGSVTYSYRQNYSNVAGAPKNHFLSLHAPIVNHKFGVGANVFQEDVNFIRNTYASAAFAYHIHFDKFTILSAGVSGEYNISRLNGNSNTIGFEPDPVLNELESGEPTYDFSFGMNFQNRFLKAGFAANRLSTAWLSNDASALSNYYSGYVQGLIPIRGGDDLLEPYIAFRKFSETNNTYDLGLFYTFNNLLLGGVAFRKGSVLHGTIGFKPSKYLLIGYSREMIANNLGGFVGAANEITLRYDFADQSYKERFSADYKSSMAYRRKTLSGPVSKSGSRNPKEMSRNQKKLAPYSPNSRYQNVKKLSMGRKSHAPKKKSYNTKKRRKSNYKNSVSRRRR